MELLTCPNCTTVYGDANDVCPNCDADSSGDGGRLELDVTSRAAVARLGGLFGGILEDGSDYVLWCGRGICLVSDEAGLLWERGIDGRVDGVRVTESSVLVSCGPFELVFDRTDGSPVH